MLMPTWWLPGCKCLCPCIKVKCFVGGLRPADYLMPLLAIQQKTGPRSAVGNVSGYTVVIPLREFGSRHLFRC